MNTVDVINAFVDKINQRDVDGLCDLMSDDHIFIDAMDTRKQGKEKMREGWKGYYSMVPDYWIKVEKMYCDGESVAAVGRAGGTYSSGGPLKLENRWDIPAAWYGIVRNDKVVEWRVFADNEPIRQIIEREHEEEEKEV